MVHLGGRFLFLLASVAAFCSCGDSATKEVRVWNDYFEFRASVDIPFSEVREFVSIATETVWVDARGVSLESLRHGEMEWAAGGNAGAFARLAAADRRAAKEYPYDYRVLDTPFWGGLSVRLATKGQRWSASATSLFYEIRILNSEGALVDTIVDPPPSWKPARAPAQGEFGVQDDGAFAAYLSSFSILTSLAIVADSVLVVHRGELSKLPGGTYLMTTKLADIYANGRLLAWDLEAPGELFAYSRGSLFFIAHSGEAVTISEFAWRTP